VSNQADDDEEVEAGAARWFWEVRGLGSSRTSGRVAKLPCTRYGCWKCRSLTRMIKKSQRDKGDLLVMKVEMAIAESPSLELELELELEQLRQSWSCLEFGCSKV